jgi:branched-chain amino acid aminotransferase
MPAAYININGLISEPPEAYNNSAFRYGYGLFETILVHDGAIMLRDFHWQRLKEGLRVLFPACTSYSPAWFKQEILRTVRKNELESLCRVRLQVFADNNVFADASPQASYIIECLPLEPAIIKLNEKGLHIGMAGGLQKSIDNLSNLKTCSNLIYGAAAQQALTGNLDDVCILNTQGNIAETTIANLFWVKNSRIFTPPLTEGCVAGVMRSHLLEQLPALGYSIKEQPLTTNLLEAADEIFLTNAIRRIKWVGNINGKTKTHDLATEIYTRVFP